MKIDTIAVACCFIVGLFCAAHISGELGEGRECKLDLDRERALRVQAANIEMKLIQEAADEWCEDSIDHAYEALEMCEASGPSRYPEECGECWNAWTMDMGGSCDSMNNEKRDAVEDSMFMYSAMHLWGDYVDARISDCESRGLKTREEREKCLGPAAHSEEVGRALEAMSIHQESRM